MVILQNCASGGIEDLMDLKPFINSEESFSISAKDLNGVTSIPDYAFYNCKSLIGIELPDTVTSIGNYAFYGCENLESVIIPNNILSIGNEAFTGCNKCYTNRITFSDYGDYYKATIDDDAKIACVPYIYNNKPVTTLGGSWTIKHNALQYVNLANGITTFEDYALLDCVNLHHLDLPTTLTSIGDSALKNNGLDYLIMPDSVTYVNQSMCSESQYLQTVTTSSNLQELSIMMFASCPSLTSANITDGVEFISGYAFYNCTGLNTITLPMSVTSIGAYVFRDCSNLSSVYLYENIAEIGYWAFANCVNLSDIYYNGTMDDWANNISLVNDWDYNTGNYIIHCTDGDISKQ